jgi:hypothetical protein
MTDRDLRADFTALPFWMILDEDESTTTGLPLPSLFKRERASYQIPSQSILVSSDGSGMIKTGFRVRCNTELETLPRKVWAKNPFP